MSVFRVLHLLHLIYMGWRLSKKGLVDQANGAIIAVYAFISYVSLLSDHRFIILVATHSLILILLSLICSTFAGLICALLFLTLSLNDLMLYAEILNYTAFQHVKGVLSHLLMFTAWYWSDGRQRFTPIVLGGYRRIRSGAARYARTNHTREENTGMAGKTGIQ